jgi:hypothetical protein
MLPVLCQEKDFPHLVSGTTPVEALADRKKNIHIIIITGTTINMMN